VIVRLVYLRTLFSLAAIARNVAKGLVPALGALAGAAAVRLALWGGERTETQAVAELAVFAALVVGITAISERELLREFRGYLNRGRTSTTQAPDVVQPSEAV
jgi:hypothetical protein